MKVLTCAAARRRLEAFHDQELPIADQIAVASHLDWCDACAECLADLGTLRTALRAGARRLPRLLPEEEASLQAAVVSRIKAERAASSSARLRAMFDDMHLVYVGAGAAVAAFVCVMVMLTMFRFATIARPDSLAAIVNLLGSPGSDLNPVPVDARVLMPRPLDEAFPINLKGDAVFTLAAVVTRDGRVENLELLRSFAGQPEPAGVDEAIESVMGAMSRARFEPARVDGLPVAVNMVWLVAHTTVRGDARALPTPAPRAGRKRASTDASPLETAAV
jgi:hypothetical protein